MLKDRIGMWKLRDTGDRLNEIVMDDDMDAILQKSFIENRHMLSIHKT